LIENYSTGKRTKKSRFNNSGGFSYAATINIPKKLFVATLCQEAPFTGY